MDNQVHNQIVSFIWGIADDCLRDVYVRGKYRDVILPMTVIRRLDALLEDSKEEMCIRDRPNPYLFVHNCVLLQFHVSQGHSSQKDAFH